VILSILPRINSNGYITLATSLILVDLQNIARTEIQNGEVTLQLPLITRRSYSGVVTSKFGDTLVIAGLIGEKKDAKSMGLPILSRIPI